MPDSATNFLLAQGVLGVVCLGLVWAVIYLYRDNKALQKSLLDLQNVRVQDVKDVNDKIVPVMTNFSQTANLIYDKLRISKESK